MILKMLKQYPVWLGLAVIVVFHFVGGGWWMDTADRGRTMLIAVTAASFLVGITSANADWISGLHFLIGFMAGMVAILFVIGPGTIWPIVLVIGGGMAAMMIVIGFGFGVMVRAGLKAVTS